MLSKKNLEELKLTEGQLEKYKDFERKRTAFRSVLNRCKVHPNVIEKILANSDLNKVDLNNLEALEENIKQTWSDFIIKKD